jgi:hypothetical protein
MQDMWHGAPRCIAHRLPRHDVRMHQARMFPRAPATAVSKISAPAEVLPGGVWRSALFWGGIFLLLLAARLLFVAQVASVVPFWDEWDSDVIALFLPPLNGVPGAGLIFAHHNEHLIALTRLYDLGLFWIEGKHWSVLTETLLNQVYYCGFATFLVAWLSRALPPAYLTGMVLASTLVLINPFGWEALSWAFESSIYLCIILSVAAFLLIAARPPDSVLFWCGIAAAGLSALSFGSGMVTLLTATVLAGFRYLPGHHRVQASAAIAVLLAMLAMAIVSTPYGNDLHHKLHVVHVAALTALVMSWPRDLQTPAMVYWPALLLLTAGCAGWRKRDTLFWFTAAICLWEMLIAMQLAISRSDAPITSRYTELLVVGIVVNLAACRT